MNEDDDLDFSQGDFDYGDEYYEDDYGDFYDPGGHSSLRAGVREYPCPTCGEPDRLTAKDVRLRYQCDDCADIAEGRSGY